MPNDEILKGWSREKKADPIRVDVNGSVITNFKFPENVFGQFSLKVKANDSAGYDIIDLNVSWILNIKDKNEDVLLLF